jgi:hypothetical protein
MSQSIAPSNSKRHRSPSYPYIGINEAISKIKVIYKQEQLHSADSNTLAVALGYSKLGSGRSLQLLSTLKQYNLLVGTGGGSYKLSSTAISLVLQDDSYDNALQSTILAPPLFQDLYSEYGQILPSDTNLTRKLIDKGFAPNIIEDLIKTIRDTWTHIKKSDKPVTTTNISYPNNEGVNHSHSEESFTESSLSGEKQTPPVSDKKTVKRLNYDLSNDTEVTIDFFGTYSKEMIDDLIGFLNFQKMFVSSKPALLQIKIEVTESKEGEN